MSPGPLSETAQKRPYPKQRHKLSRINLKSQTAFCSVCGYTKIHVAKLRTRNTPKVLCVKRARESRESKQARYRRVRDEQRSKPGWKPRHSLSEINPQTLTAVCAVCGLTEIRKSIKSGYTRYDCATKERAYMSKYQRTHRVGRPANPHALSQVNEEEKTAVCAKCGPAKIEIWQTRKKINRRCINAKSEFAYVLHSQNVVVRKDTDETL
jgi:hypothetical protein